VPTDFEHAAVENQINVAWSAAIVQKSDAAGQTDT